MCCANYLFKRRRATKILNQKIMILTEQFLKELNEEAVATRKILGAVPTDKLDWQPHPKSMTVRQLGTHIAELPKWIAMAFTTDELDFEKSPYKQTPINSNNELLEFYENSLKDAREYLKPENEKKLSQNWTLRSGDTIYTTFTKGDLIRHSLNQTIHHRAQLGVYLRLMDIPVPATYGSSADDISF